MFVMDFKFTSFVIVLHDFCSKYYPSHTEKCDISQSIIDAFPVLKNEVTGGFVSTPAIFHFQLHHLHVSVVRLKMSNFAIRLSFYSV